MEAATTYSNIFDMIVDGYGVRREDWNGLKHVALIENTITMVDSESGDSLSWPAYEQQADCAEDITDWVFFSPES